MKDRQRAARALDCIAAGKWCHLDRELRPAIRVIAIDLALLDVTSRFNAMRFEDFSESLFERAAPFHRWFAADKKHDVFCHQAKNSVDIAGSSRLMPLCNEVSDGSLVCVHGRDSTFTLKSQKSLLDRVSSFSVDSVYLCASVLKSVFQS